MTPPPRTAAGLADAQDHLRKAAAILFAMNWRSAYERARAVLIDIPEAQAAAPDALRAALPPTPTICKCGAAKSYHRPQDKRDHDYEPRYPADAVRLGWDAALAAPAEHKP